MEEFDFTEDEIREQLEILGYHQVPKERLKEFQRDLEHLVKHEKSKNSSLFSTSEQSSSSDSEAQRARHMMNRHHPHPLTDENSQRQTTNGESTAFEHPRYGKENLFIAPPVIPGEGSKQPSAGSRGAHDAAPTYTLYNGSHVDRLHDEEDDEEDTTLNTTTSTERKVVKRKTIRKHNGHSEITETESESGDLESLQERLRNLPISVHISRPTTAPGYRSAPDAPHYPRPHSSRDYTSAYRLPDDYEGVKALIKPMKKDPHTKNVKKADPVSKYQKYRNSWDSHRAPGEKQHKNLRWGVREQMLYHDQVVDKKQHKVYIPNTYIVPSDKKRKNLRWQIRNDMATGVVPPSMFD